METKVEQRKVDSPTSKKKSVNKDVDVPPKSPTKKKKMSPKSANRTKTAKNAKFSSPSRSKFSFGNVLPSIRYMKENDDPMKILYRAIHLENDSAEIPPVQKEYIMNHERLPGVLLASAAGRTRVDVIQAAIAIGIDMTTIIDGGCKWNLIHAAVSSGTADVLEIILDSVPKSQLDSLINEYSALLGTTKWTPLLLAVKSGFHEAVPLLLKHGANSLLPVSLVTPDVRDKVTGEVINKKEGDVYPLFFAIKNCPVEAVRSIFENMTELNPETTLRSVRDSKGRTVIHYLSERPLNVEGSPSEILQYLVNVDGEIHTIRDNLGNTPLHECCRRGNDDMTLNFLTLLSTVGVKLSHEAMILNNDDLNPFQIATANGMSRSVRALIVHCQEIFDDDQFNKTLLEALEQGKITIANSLVTLKLTEFDELEQGAYNALIGLTNEPDQTQIVRMVKKLGAYYCMSFISEFTKSEMNDSTAKKRQDNQKTRSKGGHFLTLLKEVLFKEGRHEDWAYIRVVSELTHKRMRGKPMKKVTKKEFASVISLTDNQNPRKQLGCK